MKVETRLPLGKLDPGVRATAASLDIRAVAEDARRAEALGYDGIITEETKDDPYIVMALAAQATGRVSLATAVALAFPRSPTVTAMTAWTLQRLSGGRFTLGLGSQVKGHIERRFGMSWSAPGPWLREYVAGAARDLGLLAERHQARFPRRALQAQSDGAAVHAGADRAPADPGRAGRGQPVYVPGRRRGRGRHPRPPDRDAALYRRDDAAGGATGAPRKPAATSRALRCA